MNNIQNIQISTHGAELTSLVANECEYIWQGDSAYWGRHAPLLFPIVGRLVNDTLRIEGHEFRMKQHGFARDAEFVQNQMHFEMVRDVYGLDYPYAFDLTVDYMVNGNTLACEWKVYNRSDKNMHFQIGAHPAFNLPDYNKTDEIHGYIQCYDSNGKIVLPMVFNYLEDGLKYSYGTPKTLLNEKAILELKNDTFANDAILLEAKEIASIALFDKHSKRVLTVSCLQANAFGIWAPNKPGCPFVCIEPWCGIADRYDFRGDISEREYDKCLGLNDTFYFNYMIEIH